jgi:hypothetical protein
VLEDVAALHEGVVAAGVQVLVGDAREAGRGVGLAPELLGEAAVGEQVGGEDAPVRVLGGAQDGGAGAVAEEDADVPPGGREVHAGGMDLGAHQQHAPVLAGTDPGVGDGQAVDEARALVADVQRRDALDPSFRWR